MTMTLQERIDTLAALGDYIGRMEGRLEFVIRQAKINNGWFTVENIKHSLSAIHQEFLNKEKLLKWVADYTISDEIMPKRVVLILAGNIPLVGFQDIMNVFVAGHIATFKCSDKDRFLIPHLIKVMIESNPKVASYFKMTERMNEIDAMIATGSNNSARYFEAYFGKYPNIIRRNRNSIAIIDGSETEEDFKLLSDDVFNYFGLGCRNVSKIYVPKDYDFNPLLEVFHERKDISNHGKYHNNFDYNIAFQILNRTPYYNNGAIIMIESPALSSRIAQLHYEHIQSEDALYQELVEKKEQIQCIVSKNSFRDLDVIPFGKSQQPTLWDYADNVDTMKFLTNLN